MSSSNKLHYEADPDEVKYVKTFTILLELQYCSSDKPAELVQVTWLEITGETKEPLPVGKYEIKFEVSLEQGAFGWNGCPVFMMGKIGKKGRYRWTKINLADLGPDKKLVTSDFQIEVFGESEDNKLYFGLYEVWSGRFTSTKTTGSEERRSTISLSLCLRMLSYVKNHLVRAVTKVLHKTLNFDMDYEERSEALSGPHWKGDGSSVSSDSACPATCRVPAKALNIIWGNDPRFWQWIKLSEEETGSIGFNEGTMLLQVNWVEVTGKLSTTVFNVASTTKYELYYVMKFQVDAFGWHSVPINFRVRLSGQESVRSIVLQSYREKHDVWHEICGGEFTVSKNAAGVVEFGMFEVDSDWWKGSMVLAGIKIRPKAVY
ncbi:unnamed protein product [Dovyalis caffra]|uniref:Uncharacterized protein n=1 Tax=Dovyalis caffra TaxID=77055 RepID=A0AAV1RM66_9ROSI|nr:unnamed protein product [Dovyalis caffra]